MKVNNIKLRFSRDPQFNLTPMIDVVFLLIIFFMLICQFIVQENYKLIVPDDCTNAIVPEKLDPGAITVSVFPNSNQQRRSGPPGSEIEGPASPVLYAVRSYRFDPAHSRYRQNPDLLIADMTEQIVRQGWRKNNPLIHLRADKDLTYGDVQQALLALAQANITKVQLAAFRSEQADE